MHLEREQLAIREVHNRIEILDTIIGKDIRFFGECRLHSVRGCSDGWAGIRPSGAFEMSCEHVDHGKEDGVQRLLGVLYENQVVDVWYANFRWEARIDS